MEIEARHLAPGDYVRREFLDTPLTLRVVETIHLAHEGLVRVVLTGPDTVLLTSYMPDTRLVIVRRLTLAA